MFLQEQIEKIDGYPDKSLFYQNPQIIEGWVKLVRATEKIKDGYDPESVKDWLQRTETYVGYLITLRKLNLIYKSLELKNLDLIKKLIDFYDGWEERGFINADLVESLSGGKYLGVLKKDITQNYEELNSKLLHARSVVNTILFEDINNFLLAVMDRVSHNLMSLAPTVEDFAKAIDEDLREWTKHFGNKLIRDMKEDLNRHYKVHRTDHNTIELWSDMLDADEKALNMSKRQELAECDEPKQEHWGEDMKKQMDENGRLMQQILSSCRSDELLDLGKAENVEHLIPLLTPDNLDMFYEIIVRRSLIQCEMFPELKAQHDDWLNKIQEKPDDGEDSTLREVRQSKLDEIIGILQNGNWKQPATAENVELLLNAVFGRDLSSLDEGDETQCEKMWALVENGKGKDRKVIVAAKLAGFLGREENLMKVDGPKAISDDLFGKANNQVSAINKGKLGCSSDFDAVIPFLKKYIDKIIRQV